MTPDWKPILSYAEEERVRKALAATEAADRRGAPARVEALLLAELRRRNRRATFLRLTTAGALAAALLVALWLIKPTPAVPSPTPAPQVAEHATPPAQPAPSLTAAPPLLAVTSPPRPAGRRRAPRPAPRPANTDDEAAEFIPVGTWQAYEPIERGSIVRVRLPKSSLPGFGIPVSAERWNESVPADVVLAEDGSMRAIRFVSNMQ